MTRATYGRTSPEPFAYYDPDASCWRTSQGTFPWDLGTYSETWPRSGSMRNGACSERPTLAHHIYAPECSSLLGTPTGRDWKDGIPQAAVPTNALLGRQVWALLPTPVVNDMGESIGADAWDEWAARQAAADGRSAPHGKSLAIEAARLLPTPTHNVTTGPSNAGREGSPNLQTQLAWIGDSTDPPSNDGPPSSAGDQLTLPMETDG